MIVSFCGHRFVDDKETMMQKISSIVENLIKNGADEFLLGGYGDFDVLSAYVIKKFQIKYPHIKSILVIPYINKKYDENLYDFSEYPPLEKVPNKLAIIKRNEYMVDKCHVLIAYVIHGGGAKRTLDYANKKNKIIISIDKNHPAH